MDCLEEEDLSDGSKYRVVFGLFVSTNSLRVKFPCFGASIYSEAADGRYIDPAV
jgi:hypothetical protein